MFSFFKVNEIGLDEQAEFLIEVSLDLTEGFSDKDKTII